MTTSSLGTVLPSDADPNTKPITIVFPMDPSVSGWSSLDLLMLAKEMGGRLQTVDVVSIPGMHVCDRRVTYFKDSGGRVQQKVEVLQCEGACGSPESECQWVEVKYQKVAIT